MNRRDFMKTTGATVAGLAGATQVGAAPATGRGGKRPNIVYIMTDQQTADTLSCAGNPHVKTPGIDSLAKTGTRFAKTYCAQPLCVPSRTVMMTGRMPHETGVTVNMKRHPIRFPMLGRMLSDAGYDCGYVGKWHLTVPVGDEKTHGFRSVMAPVSAARGRPKDDDVPPACAKFLNEKRDKPFFLVASLLNPHDICQHARGDDLPNGPVGELPDPKDCPPLPANHAIPEGEPEALREIQPGNPRLYPTIDWPPERWRQYLWAYYRLVEMVDAEIGRVLEALRRSGHEDDTVVIFSSDHGDGAGSHRWNQKQCLYDQPARVPFIVSQKGVTRPGAVDAGHLVNSGADLLPTLCDYAGLRPPPGLEGMSVRALAEGRQVGRWRDQLVVETTFCGIKGGEKGDLALAGRMLRTDRFKYIVYSRGEQREQLFDMETDPGETESLVGSPKHQAALNDHRRRMAAWCERKGDVFPVPAAG